MTPWTWRLTAKESFMSMELILKLVVMQLSQSECGFPKSHPRRLCNLSSLQFNIFQLLAWFGNKSQHSHTLWEYCHSLFLHLLRIPTPPLRTGSHQQCTTLRDHFWAKYTSWWEHLLNSHANDSFSSFPDSFYTVFSCKRKFLLNRLKNPLTRKCSFLRKVIPVKISHCRVTGNTNIHKKLGWN